MVEITPNIASLMPTRQLC